MNIEKLIEQRKNENETLATARQHLNALVLKQRQHDYYASTMLKSEICNYCLRNINPYYQKHHINTKRHLKLKELHENNAKRQREEEEKEKENEKPIVPALKIKKSKKNADVTINVPPFKC